MEELPFFVDIEDAVEFYELNPNRTNAVKAYTVAFLSKEGLANKDIRDKLKIKDVYTVTHLKRTGSLLSDTELTLWHNNPTNITLGHTRAIAKLPRQQREDLLRGLLTKKTAVHKFELIAQGKIENHEKDTDIKRYELIMSEVLGRPIKIRFNQAKKSGTLALDFFGLDDLEDLSKALGFKSEDHL